MFVWRGGCTEQQEREGMASPRGRRLNVDQAAARLGFSAAHYRAIVVLMKPGEETPRRDLTDIRI